MAYSSPIHIETHTHTQRQIYKPLTSNPERSEYFLAGLKDGGPSMELSVGRNMMLNNKTDFTAVTHRSLPKPQIHTKTFE